jgi:hypothetical protein
VKLENRSLIIVVVETKRPMVQSNPIQWYGHWLDDDWRGNLLVAVAAS